MHALMWKELETSQGENALHFAAGCGSLEVRCQQHAVFPCMRGRARPCTVEGVPCAAGPPSRPDPSGDVCLDGLVLAYCAKSFRCEEIPCSFELHGQEDANGHTPLFWAVAQPSAVRRSSRPKQRSVSVLRRRTDAPLLEILEDRECFAQPSLSKKEWTALHAAAVKGHTEVLQTLLPHCSTEVILALDRHGCSARDLAKAGHEEAAEVLLQPEVDRHLARSCHCCVPKQPEVKLSDLLAAALRIQAPVLEKVGHDAVELSCHVVDLQFRVSGYVVEVKHCGGPDGAAPARVYYARTVEQRKVESVEFLVPRIRSSGQAVWQRGERYKFRIRGCCERRLAPEPGAPRQVVSDWSISACLTPQCRHRASSARAARIRRLSSFPSFRRM
ncbi:unnamed protein product [Symbiodinium natans]|uniref:Uncharacterized protein n=1 Tax=Symbiodinium natans TaxID=878477 RepID=A0A812PQV7_9DINO|nr:unnamed protein product [Symbiodinium natans]